MKGLTLHTMVASGQALGTALPVSSVLFHAPSRLSVPLSDRPYLRVFPPSVLHSICFTVRLYVHPSVLPSILPPVFPFVCTSIHPSVLSSVNPFLPIPCIYASKLSLSIPLSILINSSFNSVIYIYIHVYTCLYNYIYRILLCISFSTYRLQIYIDKIFLDAVLQSAM